MTRGLPQPDSRILWRLVGLGAVLEGVFVAITLSAQSLHVADTGTSTLLVMLGLFAVACIGYLIAARWAVQAPAGRALLVVILGFGVLFRLTMLFSNPIEEIDLYRYLWDGAVVAEGVSPYRYTPQQVLALTADDATTEELGALLRARDSSPVMHEILGRIHFGSLPTIYPPVSQAIFGLSAALTPSSASLVSRLTHMKAWFVACDVLTMFVVLQLLRLTGQPIGLVVFHAWCPLLIKEFANSGHLDALACLLTTIAGWLAIKTLFNPIQPPAVQRGVVVSGAMLALATGAKLYPVILVPLFLASIANRCGWRSATVWMGTYAIVTALCLWPMWPTAGLDNSEVDPDHVEVRNADEAPLPPVEVDAQPPDPTKSLRAFLSHWEMNDFLFLIAIENTRPTANLPPEDVAWFSVVPESWRIHLVSFVSSRWSLDPARVPFLITRFFASIVFVGIALGLAWRSRATSSAQEWLATAFLTTAWFWLLLPTQNPWYWTWCLPFLPFATSRTWRLMSCLAFFYYLRFWLIQYAPEPPFLGTVYSGPRFFDFVLTWVEFAPWFALIASDVRRRRRLLRNNEDDL